MTFPRLAARGSTTGTYGHQAGRTARNTPASYHSLEARHSIGGTTGIARHNARSGGDDGRSPS
jgi:hypothetical protein